MLRMHVTREESCLLLAVLRRDGDNTCQRIRNDEFFCNNAVANQAFRRILTRPPPPIYVTLIKGDIRYIYF